MTPQQEQDLNSAYYGDFNMAPPNYYQYTQAQNQHLFHIKPDINTTSRSMSNLQNYHVSNVSPQRVQRRRWNVTPSSKNGISTQLNFQQQQQVHEPSSDVLSFYNPNVDESSPEFVGNATNNISQQYYAQQNQYQHSEKHHMTPTISASVSLNALRSATIDVNNFNTISAHQNNQIDNRKSSGGNVYYPASHFSRINISGVNSTNDSPNNGENFTRKSSTRNSFSKRYLKNIEVFNQFLIFKFILLFY